jgi:hypothetical protein
MYPKENNQPSLVNLGIIALVFTVVAAYAGLAMNTGDALWFWPYFSEEPQQVMVHCYGETVPVSAGSGAFTALTEAVNDIMSGRKRWDPLSLSDETYNDYLNHPEMLTVEVIYAPAVRVHSIYKFFSYVENLIIPLDARHAHINAVFARNNGQPSGGSLIIEGHNPLLDAVADQGLCQGAAFD